MNATTADGVQGDDVAMVCHLVDGLMIDDDNAPAPENIPTPNNNTDGIFGKWEHSGSCYRALAGGRRLKARISYPPHKKPSLFNMFELFFFTSFVKDVIIPQTNRRLTANGIIVSSPTVSFYVGLVFGCLCQCSMVPTVPHSGC